MSAAFFSAVPPDHVIGSTAEKTCKNTEDTASSSSASFYSPLSSPATGATREGIDLTLPPS
jgi:hypothetical protein